MSIVNKKRDQLEDFVREQILGPGGCGNRFFLLKDWEAHPFAGHSLHACAPKENCKEIMDEVPAYYYGTGILFPEAVLLEEEEEGEENEKVDNEGTKGESTESGGHQAEDDIEVEKASISEENRTAGNQNYPSSCGLSFAVTTEHDLSTNLKVEVAFRYYRPISIKDVAMNLGIWIEEFQEEIGLLVKQYLAPFFLVEERDGNHFLVTTIQALKKDDPYRIDYIALEKLQHEYLGLPEWTEEKTRFHGSSKTIEGYTFIPIWIDDWIKELQNRFLTGPLVDRDIELAKRLSIIKKVKELAETFKGILSRKRPLWKCDHTSLPVTLPPYNGNQRQSDSINIYQEDELAMDMYYQYIRRKDTLYIKLVLVNKSAPLEIPQNAPFQLNKKDEANIKSFFDPVVTVTEITRGTLQRYNPPNIRHFDKDEDLNKILYRQYVDLGEGYNTSVCWGDFDGLRYIRTDYLPTSDTPNVSAMPGKLVDGNTLSRLTNPDVLRMKELSTLSARSHDAIRDDLYLFIDDYANWIKEKSEVIRGSELDEKSKTILKGQLIQCTSDLDRLRRNIELLEEEDAMAAFRTANTAMFLQLHHSLFIRDAENKGSLPYLRNSEEDSYRVLSDQTPDGRTAIAWRPFQLAFILLNIDGFVQPKNDQQFKEQTKKLASTWYERNDLADLVWFPTGGGKTEAYLGLIAFAIAIRRFRYGSKGAGTTVLMRYTLRLLTLQQFQRATLLICALELIRSRGFNLYGKSLGDERITIGLYVGKGSSPNTWEGDEGMKAELKKILQSIGKGEQPATKIPHTECPWCGGQLWELNESDSFLITKNGQGEPADPLQLWCRFEGCAFNDPSFLDNDLPLVLYDEQIYKTPPTLLFGTVDKFAQLAHKVSNKDKEDSRRIFGKYNNGVLPPELIIQDELHLLLGPLGSAVAMFEKAIDRLCTYRDHNGVIRRPKVITSTATTRNTDKQIFGLFDRDISIFPKLGIDCDDSFFAYYERNGADSPRDYRANRRYVGVLPFGKTQVWMQLRIVAACLTHRGRFLHRSVPFVELLKDHGQVSRDIGKTMDYYHTVLGYFNSLKEVGKTESQLQHYLPNEINLIKQRSGSWNFIVELLNSGERIHYSELTGRLNGNQVKSNLNAIKTPWRLEGPTVTPPEYVISTNMISVGVDISRLNVMVVTSMPRNIAEYIQASSRVARDKEGIVFTVHHPFRSRDLSHYQHFVEFHEKFYSYVEPISITPFASKALERYFALFLATIVRHEKAALSINANTINSQLKDEIIRELHSYLDALHKRAVDMDMNEIFDRDELTDTVKKLVELVDERWFQRRLTHQNIEYSDQNSSSSLYHPRKGEAQHKNWNVKGSLREVDPESVIKTVQI